MCGILSLEWSHTQPKRRKPMDKSCQVYGNFHTGKHDMIAGRWAYIAVRNLLTTTLPVCRWSMVVAENKRGVFCNDDSSKNSLNCVNLSCTALADRKWAMCGSSEVEQGTHELARCRRFDSFPAHSKELQSSEIRFTLSKVAWMAYIWFRVPDTQAGAC